MTLYIVPIVEGQTEVDCVEPLLHRIWNELLVAPIRLQVEKEPVRCKRDKLIKLSDPHLATKFQQAYAKLAAQLKGDPSGVGCILLLIDAEGDCPAQLAPQLLKAAPRIRPDVKIVCVMPKRMLENWLVAASASLAGMHGLPEGLSPPIDCEDCHGANWLDAQLRRVKPSRKYVKAVDGQEFVRQMSLQECRDRSPSFDKLCREMEALLPRETDSPDAEPL